MKPTVLIFRSELLPPSETFIPAQACGLRRFSPFFAGLRAVPASLSIDSEESLLLTRTSNPAAKLRRRLFLETGIAPEFLRALERRHPALIHAHFAVDAAAALPIARSLDVPLIVTLHGYDVTSPDAVLRRTAAGRVFLRRRPELRARASLFICVSEHLRQRALARGFPAEKLRTLHTGVDLDLFAPDPLYSRARDPIILFVGRLVEVKGCAHLIRAISLIEQHHPTAKLLIVGDGPLLDPLRAQARAAARHITFLGAQPSAVVRDLMHRATLLAAPSIVTPDGISEALNMAVCEAQAMALPVVGFRAAGVEEAVADRETALLVPEVDHAALADAISTLLSDPALAARLGAAGRRRAEAHFNLATQTARLEDLYASLLP